MGVRVVGAIVGLVVSFAVCGGATRAGALELYDEDEVSVEANVHAGAVAGAEIYSDQSDDYGLALDLARVKFGASFAERASLKLQVAGSSGTVELLDAAARLRPTDGLAFQMGRYKTAVSEEYQFSAADLPFIGRALLNSLVPRRAVGFTTFGSIESGGVEIEPRAGIYQPPRTTFADPQGQLVSGRVMVTLPSQVYFHAGYAQHVFTDNQLPGDGAGRVFAFDQPLDAAVGYRTDTWNLHLEGVTVFDPPGVDTAYGGYAHALYRFGGGDEEEEELEFEPGVAYDIIVGGDDIHRGTVGLNTYWWGTGFQTLLDYRLTYNASTESAIHAVLLNLRGKL